MSHEPIILNKESWPDAHSLAQYSLNRLVANHHDLRNDINSENLKMREDIARNAALSNTNSIRIAVLEAKMLIYAAIGGAVGMALMHWVIGKF